jgi:hypothetical protein
MVALLQQANFLPMALLLQWDQALLRATITRQGRLPLMAALSMQVMALFQVTVPQQATALPMVAFPLFHHPKRSKYRDYSKESLMGEGPHEACRGVQSWWA